ncbi:MAG: hypothetical protein ACOCW6_07160 [Spirochaetota bacterium]
MSFQEKRSVAIMVAGITIFAVYFAIVLSRYRALPPAAAADAGQMLRFWAAAMLILIPVSVVAHIIILILFMIVYHATASEDAPDFEDERDKLIELKADRIAHVIFMIGFVAAMAAVVLNLSVTGMFVAFAVSGLIAEVAGEAAKIRYYRRGV